MTPEERQLLTALAQRVKTVPPQQKDPEAEQFIGQLVAERPDTPYVLAQTVIMQDFALRNAQSQIEDLQRQLAGTAPPAQERPGSFLGGLFGRSQSPQPSTSYSGSVPRVNPWARQDAPPPPPPPGYGQGPGPGYGYGQPPGAPVMQPSQTGSFLRGAASTAVGVAGGALLFQGISSMFSGHSGLANASLSGINPQNSLSASAIPDDRSGQADYGGDPDRGVQQADYGGDTDQGVQQADYGGDSDFDSDFGGGGDDYA